MKASLSIVKEEGLEVHSCHQLQTVLPGDPEVVRYVISGQALIVEFLVVMKRVVVRVPEIKKFGRQAEDRQKYMTKRMAQRVGEQGVPPLRRSLG